MAFSPERLGGGMAAAAWILAAVLLTWLFSGWLADERNPNQEVQTVRTMTGATEVALVRNRAGHYVATGQINGAPVEFLLDTGATDVAIPGTVARDLGLRLGARTSARTANGVVQTYSTLLSRVELGGIVVRNVRATILPEMDGDEVLLGMSFLKHIELTQRGNTLTLSQYPPYTQTGR